MCVYCIRSIHRQWTAHQRNKRIKWDRSKKWHTSKSFLTWFNWNELIMIHNKAENTSATHSICSLPMDKIVHLIRRCVSAILSCWLLFLSSVHFYTSHFIFGVPVLRICSLCCCFFFSSCMIWCLFEFDRVHFFLLYNVRNRQFYRKIASRSYTIRIWTK